MGPGGHDLCRACLWASNSCDGAGCASGSAANAWLHRLCSSGTHLGWHTKAQPSICTCQLSLLPAPACPTVAAGCVHVSWRKGTIVLPPCLAAASTDRISSAGVLECGAAAACAERVPTCCFSLQVDLPVLTLNALASRLPAGAPLPCWCRTGCEVAASGRQQRANTGSNACFFNAPLASTNSARLAHPLLNAHPPFSLQSGLGALSSVCSIAMCQVRSGKGLRSDSSGPIVMSGSSGQRWRGGSRSAEKQSKTARCN